MALTDESKIAFGKYEGTPLKDVPASYLLWLIDQDKFFFSTLSYHISLKEYIQDNMKGLQREAAEQRNAKNK